ncbi:hypothetical protein [Frondihabitans cladoniiphilus]|uniref:Uncharacterized protein n=1 Tax=Frondihabitans cladoniiphilus TaxID=715785 RepID=A0ABP8WAB3_9MICO
MSRRRTIRRGASPENPDEGGRITVIEVVGYTAGLAFVAALALGAFDAMLTWK